MIASIKKTAAATLLACTAVAASANPTINLIDIGGVTGSQAELGFKIAAKYWENMLTNNATINFNVGFSDLGPNVLGSTGTSLYQFVPIGTYYALLAGNQSSALDAQAVANLAPLSGTGSVTVKVPEYLTPATQTGAAKTGTRTAPDGMEISNTMAIASANVKALIGGSFGATDVDAEIQFSSTFAFDFNPMDGISAGTYDFIGVAIHEMGHALGFISGADDFDYIAKIKYNGSVDDAWWGYGLDMFRYSAPGVLDWTFGTNSYFSIDGGQTAYMGGYFSTGAYNGDENQASHWKQPNQSNPCNNFLGIMNPYICGGKGDSVSALDLAAFDAIGWNLNVDVTGNPNYSRTTAQIYQDNTVPEPGSLVLVASAFGLMAGALRRRQRKAAEAAA